MGERKEYPNHALEGFTIKTIEGFGDKAQYWRIANELVRGSRVFRSMSLKLYRQASQTGLQRRYRILHRARYFDLLKTFKEYERDVNSEFKKQQKKIERLERELARYKDSYKAYLKKFLNTAANNRHHVKANNKLRSDSMNLRKVKEFLTLPLGWDRSESDKKRAELMLRALFGFKDLEGKGEITFSEMVYLSVGFQLDAFNRKNIQDRFGEDAARWFGRDIKKLIDKGYIRRFERKAFYYLTLEGKDKFTSMMKSIYSAKMGTYWADIFK